MLVLVALGIESWIEPSDASFSLRVAESDEDAALRALAADARDAARLVPAAEAPSWPGAWDGFWAGMVALMLAGFHLLASSNPGLWRGAGVADSARIVGAGEWYRAGTALCLHADLSHLAANLLFGGLFIWFLSPRLGAGASWLLVFAAGFFGNLTNAYAHGAPGHRSLGASTSVFGALGLLVGLEMVNSFRGGGWGPMRRVLVPFGAGLALLAWLGTEGEQTDVLAHLWGFSAGLVLGLGHGLAAPGGARPPGRRWARVLAGASAAAGVAGCWWLAMPAGNGR